MAIEVLAQRMRVVAGGCVLAAGLVTGSGSLIAQDGAGGHAGNNGGGSIKLESLVPEDTMAFVSFAGMEECSRAAKQLGLYKLWQEEEVQAFLKTVLGQVNGLAEQAPEQAKRQWAMAKSLLSGRISVAISGLTMVYMNDAPGFVPVPGVVASLELGSRRQMCEELIEGLLNAHMNDRPLRFFERESMQYHGHKVNVLRHKRMSPGFSVCWTFVGDSLVASLNARGLKKALDRLDGRATGSKSLAENPRLAKARTKTGATALAELFVDVPSITKRIRGLIPDEWHDVIHKLGFNGVDGAYFVSGVKGDQGFDGMFLDAAAPRRGWLSAVEAPVGKAELSRIPKTAAVVLASRDNPAKIYDLVWSCMTDIFPAEALRHVEREKAQMEQEIGLKLREDIVAAMEGAWVLYAEAPRNGFIPNVVLSVSIADRAKAERGMGVLMAAMQMEARQLEYSGHTMTVIKLPGQAPVSPSYAFVGNHLVIASTPVGLKRLIRGAKKQGPSILENEQFQAAMTGLDPTKASGLVFVDTKRVASIGYNAAETLLPGMVDEDDLPVDLAMLPSSDVVIGHLKPWAITTHFDQDGAVCRGRLDGLGAALAVVGQVFLESPGVLPYAIERMGRSMARGRPMQYHPKAAPAAPRRER